jgi:hypothetical protein
MTRFAIDAPTLLHVVSEGIAIHPDHQLVAPSTLRSQALELLLTRVRAGDLTEQEARALFDPITETKVRVLGDRMSRRTAWDIARERDWATLRQGEYLAVARLQADALVSVDPELVAAADGVVPLAPLEALSVP